MSAYASSSYGNEDKHLLTTAEGFTAYICSMRDQWKKARRDWETVWADSESRWLLNTSTKTQEWMSNVPPTETNVAVEGAYAEIKEALFGSTSGNYFDIKKIATDTSLVIQKRFLELRLNKQIKLRKVLGGDYGLRSMLIKGTLIGRVVWKQEKGVKLHYIPTPLPDGTMDYAIQEEEGLVIDRPDVEFLPLENFYIEPGCKNFEDAAKIYVETLPRSVVEETYGLNSEELDSAPYPGTTEEEQRKRRSELGLPDGNVRRSREMVEILHCYKWCNSSQIATILSGTQQAVDSYQPSGTLPSQDFVRTDTMAQQEQPKQDNTESYYHIVIANGKILVSAEKPTTKIYPDPFFKATYIPVEGEHYGIGIPYIMKGLQDELKDVKDLSLDNIKLRLYTPIKYKPRPTIDKLLIKLEPMAKIPDHSGNDVSFMEVPDATSPALAREQSLLLQIQEVTHVNKIISGSGAGLPNRTATGASILRQQSAKAFQVIVEWIGEHTIVPILERVYALDRQLTPPSKVGELMGPGFAQIWAATAPETFYQDADFEFVQAVDMVSNDFKANTYGNLINIGAKFPWFNVAEAMRRQVNAIGEDDTNLFFNSQMLQEQGAPTPPPGVGAPNPSGMSPAGGGSGTPQEFINPNTGG